jgi:hypothetical protein
VRCSYQYLSLLIFSFCSCLFKPNSTSQAPLNYQDKINIEMFVCELSFCRYFPTGGYLNSKQGDGSGWVSTKDWLDMLHGRKARPGKNSNSSGGNNNNNNNNRNNGRMSRENAPKPAPKPAAPARPAAPAPAPVVAAAPARNSFFPFFGFFG